MILKRFEIVYTTEIESDNAFYELLIKELDACKRLVETSRVNEPVRRREFDDSESESEDEESLDDENLMTNSFKSMTRVDTMLAQSVKAVRTSVSKTEAFVMRQADKRVRNQLDSRVRMTKIVAETFLPPIQILNQHLEVI